MKRALALDKDDVFIPYQVQMNGRKAYKDRRKYGYPKDGEQYSVITDVSFLLHVVVVILLLFRLDRETYLAFPTIDLLRTSVERVSFVLSAAASETAFRAISGIGCVCSAQYC